MDQAITTSGGDSPSRRPNRVGASPNRAADPNNSGANGSPKGRKPRVPARLALLAPWWRGHGRVPAWL